MNIQINYCRAFDDRIQSRPENRDSDVIEYAESRALCPERVMRSARQISSPAVLQCEPCRRERATNRGKGALDQSFRSGEADAAVSSRRKRAHQKAVHVLRIVDALDVFNLPKRSRLKFERPFPSKDLADPPIFLNRKLMPIRQRDFVVIAVEELGHRALFYELRLFSKRVPEDSLDHPEDPEREGRHLRPSRCGRRIPRRCPAGGLGF